MSRFLDKLEADGMIKQKRTTKYTRIAIVKYDEYQHKDVNGNIVRTSGGHQRDTNKNDKNEKNNKKR